MMTQKNGKPIHRTHYWNKIGAKWNARGVTGIFLNVVNCVWIYLPVPYPCPTAALQRTRFYSNLEAASRHYSAVRLYNKGASFGPKYLIMSPLNQYLEIFGQKTFDT